MSAPRTLRLRPLTDPLCREIMAAEAFWWAVRHPATSPAQAPTPRNTLPAVQP